MRFPCRRRGGIKRIRGSASATTNAPALASPSPLWNVARNRRTFFMDAPATAPGTAPKPAFKPLVFSGVQPTGNLHLGNYLGAIVRFVEMQKTHECIYCVVDLHAITVWQDPAELKKATREVTAAFIACGIDPKQHIVFNQSQ